MNGCLRSGPCALRYLAGKKQRRCHLLHGEVPDARGERAPARRAAGYLLPALAANQMARLALQDRRQNVVEAHRALEQGGELLVLRGADSCRCGESCAGPHRGRPGSCGSTVLRFGAGLSGAGAGRGRPAHRRPVSRQQRLLQMTVVSFTLLLRAFSHIVKLQGAHQPAGFSEPSVQARSAMNPSGMWPP